MRTAQSGCLGGWPWARAAGAATYGIMCSMNRRYYRDARLIEEKLWRAGRPDWALQIDDAIEGGSSASETLIGLRKTLIQIQNQHLDLPAQLDDEIEDLMRALDRAQREQVDGSSL